jgi:hypothetical protein
MSQSEVSAFKQPLADYWPALLGLLVLFVPTLYSMFTGLWMTEEQAHGPIILGLSLWLIYGKWSTVMASPVRSAPAGWPIMVIGLLLYVIGRSQGIVLFELGALVWVLAGTLLILRGGSALLTLWFPFFFMLQGKCRTTVTV